MVESAVTIQWIPGHSSIPGNELADQAAKEATTLTDDPHLPIPYTTACSVIKNLVRDEPIQHNRTAIVYKKQCARRDKEELKSRSDEVLLARLRSGHHPAFQSYQHRLNDERDATCPACREEEHTVGWFIAKLWMELECVCLGTLEGN